MDTNKIEDLKVKIQEANKTIESTYKELEVSYRAGLTELLKNNNNLIAIRCGLNAYGFNDGDVPYWSLHYEDLTLVLKDNSENDAEEDLEYDGYPENPKLESIRKSIINFIKTFDVNDCLEKIHDDCYDEQVRYSLDSGGKLVIE